MISGLFRTLVFAALVALSAAGVTQAPATVGALAGYRGWHPASLASSNAVISANQTAATQTQIQDAIAKVSPAVVSIYGYENVPSQFNGGNTTLTLPFFNIEFSDLAPAQTQVQVDAGTGFFVDSNGYILTAAHVVADSQASYTAILNDGSRHDAAVIYRDPIHDVAILKISGSNYPALPIGDSSELQNGQVLIGIGNAFGQISNFPSVGSVIPLESNIVSADQNNGGQLPTHMFETNMQLYPGDSGGPTFDLSGQVVGINDAIALDEPNVSFSVPINYAKPALAKAITNP